MHISMKADIKQATRKLRGAQRKQIPFATAKALTDTAWDVAKEEQRQLPMKLDRPTPFTKRAFGVKRATKTRLVSTVFIKPIQAAYLKFQIKGGTRHPKKRAIPVPTSNQRLNQYGNMTRGKIKALLAKPNVFSGEIKGVAGIYQRTGGKRNPGVKLLIAWEDVTQYRPRFPFYKIAAGKARAVIGRNMRRALDKALRTAK